jgi:hypothetical protein
LRLFDAEGRAFAPPKTLLTPPVLLLLLQRSTAASGARAAAEPVRALAFAAALEFAAWIARNSVR